MSEAKITLTAEDRTKAVLAGVSASLGKVQSNATSLNEGFARLAPVLGSAFAGLSFTAFIKSTAAGIDALNDIKDATGASIENISALEDTALRTGTSLETVTTSLVKLNGVLADATPGSQQEKVLAAIGLSAKELRSLDPAEALLKVSVALSGYADDANKARLIQELFGKSIREVAPLLNDLAEKGKLNATVTAEQARQAEIFGKQLAQLEKNSLDMARSIASVVVPKVNELFVQFSDGKEIFGGFWEALAGIGLGLNPTKTLGENIKASNEKIDSLQAKLKKLQEQAADPPLIFSKTKNLERQERINQELEREIKLREYAKRGQAREALALDDGSHRREDGSGEVKNAVADVSKLKAAAPKATEISEAQRALAAYVQTQGEQLSQLQEVTELEKAQNLLNELGALGEIPQVREMVIALATKNTELREQAKIREYLNKQTEEELRVEKELDAQLDQYIGKTEAARRKALSDRLQTRIAGGENLSSEEIRKAIEGIAGLKDEAKETFGELDELTKEFGRNVQDALGDTIERTLKGDFDNIGKMWSDLLFKMAAQAAAAQLGKTLFGDMFKSGGGSDTGLFGMALKMFGGSASPSAHGNAFDQAGLVAYANGGVVDSPTYFGFGNGRRGVMGEAGPEAVLPLKRGADGRLGVAIAGGQEAQGPTIVINIASGVSRNELAAMVPQLTEQVKASVMQTMRRPGFAGG